MVQNMALCGLGRVHLFLLSVLSNASAANTELRVDVELTKSSTYFCTAFLIADMFLIFIAEAFESTKRMLEILERIVDGKGEMSDLYELEELANMVRNQSAP